MQSTALIPQAYIDSLPDDRKDSVRKLRQAILDNIPKGFAEVMSYGMIGYVVPHSIYPAGYHCDPKLPLPFISFASQKNHVVLHHMGLYADTELLNWFIEAYKTASPVKPDMGKGCVKFKKPELIPFELIGHLAAKLTPQAWIQLYERSFKKK